MRAAKLYPIALLLIAFMEGGSLMASELLAAKLIAPFYGTSLYVWAAVLTITLLGIAGGYMIGGRLSRHPSLELRLLMVLLTSAIFVLIMPYIAQWIMSATVDSMNIIPGSLITAAVILLPVILLFGMVGPMLVQHLTLIHEPGKAAGALYAVSTFGGIAATMFVGFYAIAEIGIKETCFIFGGIMGAAAVLYLAVMKIRKK